MCGVERLDFLYAKDSFNFKIFQGHSGDSIAFSSDVIFPGCTFVEKEALYVSLEGRVQKTKFLLSAPSLARLDWKIVAGFRIFFFETSQSGIYEYTTIKYSKSIALAFIRI